MQFDVKMPMWLLLSPALLCLGLAVPTLAAEKALYRSAVVGTANLPSCDPALAVAAAITVPAGPAIVVLHTPPPEGAPPRLEYDDFVQRSGRALLARHFAEAPAGQATAQIELARLAAQCTVNPVRASCQVRWTLRVTNLPTRLVLISQDIQGEAADVDCRRNLSQPPFDNGEQEMYRRRLNGGVEALGQALTQALLKSDEILRSRRSLIGLDGPTLKAAAEKAVTDGYRNEACRALTAALNPRIVAVEKAEKAEKRESAKGPECAPAPAPAPPEDADGDGDDDGTSTPVVRRSSLDHAIASDACEDSLGIPVCLPSLVGAGIVSSAELAAWRERGLIAALDACGVPQWQSTPNYVILLAHVDGVFQFAPATGAFAGPLVRGGVAVVVRYGSQGLAVMADGAVWLLAPETASAAQLGVLEPGLTNIAVQSAAIDGANLVVRFTTSGNAVARTAKFGLPAMTGLAELPSGTPVARKEGNAWVLHTTLQFGLDRRLFALASDTRPPPVVAPQQSTAPPTDTFLDRARERAGWLRDVGQFTQATDLLGAAEQWSDVRADRAEMDARQARLNVANAKISEDLQEAAETARKVEEARKAEVAAAKRTESNKHVVAARKLAKANKLDAAAAEAGKACEIDGDNAEAEELHMEIIGEITLRDRAAVEKQQRREEENKLSRVQTFIKICQDAVALYERAREAEREAAVSGQPRRVESAQKARQLAEQRYGQARSNIGEIINIYARRGMGDAARAVRSNAGRCAP